MALPIPPTKFVLSFLIIIIQTFSFAFSLRTNRTIDDTYGDSATGLQVAFSNNWNTGQLCPGCGVQPDANEAFEGSWHDTTTPGLSDAAHNVTMRFVGEYRFSSSIPRLEMGLNTGTAIWVYCILVNSGHHGVTIYTNASFELDGALAGTYQHDPNPQDDQYLYNNVVFHKDDLSNTEHTLVITVGNGSPSLLLFDWAMYTYVHLFKLGL